MMRRPTVSLCRLCCTAAAPALQSMPPNILRPPQAALHLLRAASSIAFLTALSGALASSLSRPAAPRSRASSTYRSAAAAAALRAGEAPSYSRRR